MRTWNRHLWEAVRSARACLLYLMWCEAHFCLMIPYIDTNRYPWLDRSERRKRGGGSADGKGDKIDVIAAIHLLPVTESVVEVQLRDEGKHDLELWFCKPVLQHRSHIYTYERVRVSNQSFCPHWPSDNNILKRWYYKKWDQNFNHCFVQQNKKEKKIHFRSSKSWYAAMIIISHMVYFNKPTSRKIPLDGWTANDNTKRSC